MSRQVVLELATRHGVNADHLLEAWSERVAIREYLAGFSRNCAEVWAVGDIEAMFHLGLHCPQTRQMMAAGGNRKRPTARGDLR